MRNEFPAWPQEEPPASNGVGRGVNGLSVNGGRCGGARGAVGGRSGTGGLEVRGNDVLSGVVRGSRRPLAEVTVTVTDRTGSQCARATTDANGVFRIGGLEPGSYVLVFARAGYRPQATVVPPGSVPSRLDISLEPTTGVRGTVRDRLGGRPIPGATVTALGRDGEVIVSAVTGEDGGYLLAGVEASHVTLVAAAPLSDPIATVVALDGPTTVADLDLDVRGALTGVVSSGGWPLSGVRLLLRDADGAVVGSTVTDDDGHYRFGSVMPGGYTVTTELAPPAVAAVGPHTTTTDLRMGAGDPHSAAPHGDAAPHGSADHRFDTDGTDDGDDGGPAGGPPDVPLPHPRTG